MIGACEMIRAILFVQQAMDESVYIVHGQKLAHKIDRHKYRPHNVVYYQSKLVCQIRVRRRLP